jgi:hypothetical protein
MHKDQKMWDACFIKTWRQDKTVGQLFELFEMVTNQDAHEIPELERVPRRGFPYNVKLRVFTGAHMKKLNDRLWAGDPSKDVELLNKLQTVRGGVHKQYITNSDRDLNTIKKQQKKNAEKIVLNNINYKNRNQKTDWNIVK